MYKMANEKVLLKELEIKKKTANYEKHKKQNKLIYSNVNRNILINRQKNIL